MTGEVAKVDPEITDDQIADRVIALLLEAAQTLVQRKSRTDYHMQVMGMAARDIQDAARMVAHLKGPIPQPYRERAEQGPGAGHDTHGPRRYRLSVKLKRPAIYEGLDSRGNHVRVEYSEEEIKKTERARFYDYGYTAAENARAWSFLINGDGPNELIESVQVLDRLNKVLWTYDSHGDCVEIRLGEGT